MRNYSSIERTGIDRILQPVIQTVRQNKINSFVQLKNFQTRASQNHSYIFQPKPTSLSQTATKANRTFTFGFGIKQVDRQQLSAPKTARAKIQSNPEQFNFIPFSLNKKQQARVPHTRQTSRQKVSKQEKRSRIIRINSKVKKHLIERIDFEDIERCLYHKRECLTRYNYFMELKNRQKELNGGNNRALLKNRTYHLERGQEIKNHSIQDLELNIDDKEQYSTLRTTPRKKFWVKEQAKRSPNTNLFDNASTFIQGKAFKTIQT